MDISGKPVTSLIIFCNLTKINYNVTAWEFILNQTYSNFDGHMILDGHFRKYSVSIQGDLFRSIPLLLQTCYFNTGRKGEGTHGHA